MNKLIKITYNKLINRKNPNIIKEAFCNKNSLGVLMVTNIPNITNLKYKFFKTGKQFAEDKNIHENYEFPELNYSYGWSNGVEKMNKQIDSNKGSYYCNPIFNDKNNIWPKEYPLFEEHFRNFSKILYYIGLNVLVDCDTYLKNEIKNYSQDYLYNIIKKNKTPTGRFLHYYENDNFNQEDGSCSWHLDHGCLTVLPSPIYFDKDYKEIKPNDNSGLYIKDANNKTHKVNIPEDAVICQSGEILQILTGGVLQATPHCVKSSINKELSRETCPLFMDCDENQNISLPSWSKENPFEVSLDNNLKQRYNNTKNYKEFVKNTLEYYYN